MNQGSRFSEEALSHSGRLSRERHPRCWNHGAGHWSIWRAGTARQTVQAALVTRILCILCLCSKGSSDAPDSLPFVAPPPRMMGGGAPITKREVEGSAADNLAATVAPLGQGDCSRLFAFAIVHACGTPKGCYESINGHGVSRVSNQAGVTPSGHFHDESGTRTGIRRRFLRQQSLDLPPSGYCRASALIPAADRHRESGSRRLEPSSTRHSSKAVSLRPLERSDEPSPRQSVHCQRLGSSACLARRRA